MDKEMIANLAEEAEAEGVKLKSGNLKKKKFQPLKMP